jgi:hypothetical protein
MDPINPFNCQKEHQKIPWELELKTELQYQKIRSTTIKRNVRLGIYKNQLSMQIQEINYSFSY